MSELTEEELKAQILEHERLIGILERELREKANKKPKQLNG